MQFISSTFSLTTLIILNTFLFSPLFLVMKRQPAGEESAEADPQLPNKRPYFLSTMSARTLEDHMPRIESIIRKTVREEVNRAIDLYMRISDDQVGSPGLRPLQLQFQFHNILPPTVYTDNRIVSEDGSPLKFVLYDPVSKNVVACGPYSSMKVEIVVLKGDFVCEEWSKDDFDANVVHNRQDKRPLLTGETIVSLNDGIGYIADVTFTDNSSWTRSKKFRLGVKIHSDFDGMSIRQGVSNAFRVKDHRGELYRKHYPPLLDDEVWRLEKIAKDGVPHKRLTDSGVSCVRDFLRQYTMNEASLRAVFPKVSNSKWETIINHAMTCPLDETTYIYRTLQGVGLVFNSIYKAIRMTFDGLNFHSVDHLDSYQTRIMEDLKQHVYRNLSNLEVYDQASHNINPHNASFHGGQGQLEMQMFANYDFEMEKGRQELNMTSDISFEMSGGSSGSFYTAQPTLASGGNPAEAELSPHNFTTNDNFEEW